MQGRNVLVSLLVGVVVFFIVTVGVTELLASVLWPALLFGLGAGVFAGVAAIGLSYAGLLVVTERRATGTMSTETRRRVTALVGAVGVGAVAGVVVVGGLLLAASGVALAMLVGGLAALVGGVIGAVVLWVHTGRLADDPTLSS